jgi:RimJ/RimL family protein N-acetyltransferase
MYDLIDELVPQYMEWSKWDDYKDTENNLIETIEEARQWKTWQAAIYLKKECIKKERMPAFPTGCGELIWRFWMHTIDEKNNSIMLWYWLSKKFRWNGYITECVEWVKQYWFEEMWLDKITIRCVKENTASSKVAEKAWFTLDWIIRHDEIQKGKYVDNCYYSFLKEEYMR